MPSSQNSTCVLEHFEAPAQDSQNWVAPVSGPARTYLFVEEERHAAEILEESFAGVDVLLEANVLLTLHKSVELIFRGFPLWGTVRSVSRQGGQTRVGIAWIPRRPTSLDGRPRCRTASDFCLWNGLAVACRVIRSSAEKLVVQLPNCTERVVSPEDLSSTSRFRRLAHLEGAEEDLRLLIALYQIGDIQDSADALRSVLNLEFATSWT